MTAPIANLICTGQYVTLVGSSIDPNRYQAEVESFLSAYPRSSYLLTEASCGAFAARLNGNRIYAAYLGPFATETQACAARGKTGGSSYVKVLNNITPSEAQVEC